MKQRILIHRDEEKRQDPDIYHDFFTKQFSSVEKDTVLLV